MDVYHGYPTYQYNQADEIAKQMYGHQGLPGLPPQVSCPRISEPHNMPAPTGSPWTGQSLPWSLQSPPQLVQFTAQSEPKITSVPHCKRKSLDVEPPIPAKQFITEEKMAAHFNSLHISSNYTQHSLSNNDDVMEVAMEPISSQNISEKLKGHRIVLSEDVKKITEEPIIPPTLMERLQKPQMSLVVWKPRDDILSPIKEVKDNNNEAEEESPKRRGVLVPPDNNTMDIEI
ncbi:uncharacterized protein LOC121728372 [Aricia agestis]|uniref:uncharacterized protein LOC121728372 n=1 Tax=Aricia agestis TaxID=91739 RepID=UPI001C203FC3|nr:uncharacterized protein LOC121728372 [Aricia agestis]